MIVHPALFPAGSKGCCRPTVGWAAGVHVIGAPRPSHGATMHDPQMSPMRKASTVALDLAPTVR
jgi:hypothetical protein